MLGPVRIRVQIRILDFDPHNPPVHDPEFFEKLKKRYF